MKKSTTDDETRRQPHLGRRRQRGEARAARLTIAAPQGPAGDANRHLRTVPEDPDRIPVSDINLFSGKVAIRRFTPSGSGLGPVRERLSDRSHASEVLLPRPYRSGHVVSATRQHEADGARREVGHTDEDHPRREEPSRGIVHRVGRRCPAVGNLQGEAPRRRDHDLIGIEVGMLPTICGDVVNVEDSPDREGDILARPRSTSGPLGHPGTT